MATYMELYGLRQDSDLQDKIAVALVIAAHTQLSGSPTAEQAAWAKSIVSNPGPSSKGVINAVLAANKGAAVGAITGATDAAIQTAVDAVVDGLILGD